ncbi:MAG: hypothetical protein R2813_03860 [Flavobacteriales bacterium]
MPHEESTGWEPIDPNTKSHLRGLDLAADGSAWASGTEGVVLRSLDSGLTWMTVPVPSAEDLDFRDIEAIDKNTAITLNAGDGVFIYRTNDGGQHWQLVFSDTNRSLFFDGLDFNGEFGMAYGDPIDNRLKLLRSVNQGVSWHWVEDDIIPKTLDGEAGFAASGTGIRLGNSSIWIATGGGTEPRILRMSAYTGWQAISIPMVSNSTSGIFSIAFADDERGIAVGGSYVDSTMNQQNAAYTEDGGLTWNTPESNPAGYRSCVAVEQNGIAITTGRTGTDVSYDCGKSWTNISSEGYFSCAILGDRVIGVGRNGKIGHMKLPKEKLSSSPDAQVN